MEDQVCRNCKFYLQHYTFDQGRIFRVYCGHCMRGRCRRKQPDTKACGYFEAGVNQETAFATKEYLSKELLQYVLGLELLPKIEDGGKEAWQNIRRSRG